MARDGCERKCLGSAVYFCSGACRDACRRQEQLTAIACDTPHRQRWQFRSSGLCSEHNRIPSRHLAMHQEAIEKARPHLRNAGHSPFLAVAIFSVSLALLPFGALGAGSEGGPCVSARPGHLAMAKGPELQVTSFIFTSFAVTMLSRTLFLPAGRP